MQWLSRWFLRLSSLTKRKKKSARRDHAWRKRVGLEPLEERRMLALVPELIKDINTIPLAFSVSSSLQVGSVVFLSASDNVNGQELWKTDGTTAGTVLVRDIRLGANPSGPASFTNIGGTLYFSASDDTNGNELWKSDGTSSGTVLVRNISPPGSSSPANLVNVNGVLYFSASDGTNGFELWKSDGTSGGTQLVSNINPAANSSYPNNLVNVGGTLFFTASDGVNGTELWKSDGTSANTVMIRNISTSGSSTPSYLANVNGLLLFRATDGILGTELWKSDGTSSGTQQVKDINPGSANSNLTTIVNVNGVAFFRATDGTTGAELWKSDGTCAGTVLVFDINSGGGNSQASNFANVGGTLFFSANDSGGDELWKSDGTSSGTQIVKNINPSSGSRPANLVNVGGTLYFSATDGTSSYELWKSDGTSNGTVQVRDINVNGGSSPGSITPLGSSVVFAAHDGLSQQLWKSDGTSNGTTSILVNERTNGTTFGASVQIGATTYFVAIDGRVGSELWKTDGTSAGTLLVRDINPGVNGSFPGGLTNFNGTLLFFASDGVNGAELWMSDGTSDGTVMVKDINPSTGSSPAGPTLVNGVSFFTATDGVNGGELWKSDGTSSGTVLVANINPTASGSNSANFVNVGGILYFSANDGINGSELWKSDGTSSGTVMVRNISTSGSSNPSYLRNVDGVLLFRANDSANGAELWRSDGTSGGTVVVKDIGSGGSSSSPTNFAVVGNTLFFRANDGTNGYELWKSDGTSSGTVLVRDIRAGGTSTAFNNVTAVGSSIYMRLNNGTNGYELWKSDGTSSGTVLVRDINPGSNSSSPAYLTNVNGLLYFMSNDGTNGNELWVSDGASAGTRLVWDLNPGSPQSLFNANGTLLFSTDAGFYGRELYKLSDRPVVSLSASSTTLAENGAVTLTAALDQTVGQTVTVNLTFGGSSSSATFNTDYSVSGVSITIPSGQTAGTVTVTSIDDLIDELAETIVVDIDTVTGGTALENILQQVTLTIDDNEFSQIIVRVKDVIAGSVGSGASEYVTTGGKVYFVAETASDGKEFFIYDPATDTLTQRSNFTPASSDASPFRLEVLNGVVYFAANHVNGLEPWYYDPATDTLAEMADVATGTTGSNPTEFTYLNGLVYYRGSELNRPTGKGDQVFAFDPATTTNTRLTDINTGGTYGASPRNFWAVAGKLYFSAVNSGNSGDNEFYQYDPADQSVTEYDLNALTATSSSSPLEDTAVIGTKLYFGANIAEAGVARGESLVMFDASTPGTPPAKVWEFDPSTGNDGYTDFTVLGDRIYMRARDGGVNGDELHYFDTVTNTGGIAANINPGSANSSPSGITVFNGKLYFSADTADYGREAWEYDPVASTARMLMDIAPGTASSYASGFKALNGKLYFSADDPTFGSELRVYDPVTDLVTLVEDVSPGPTDGVAFFSSFNSVVLGSTLYLTANDGSVGSEMFKLQTLEALPDVSLSISGSPLAENGGVATVVATLTSTYSQNVTINLGFTGAGTSGVDYAASAPSIVVLAGQLTGSVTLTAINDTTFEGSETVVVDITSVTNGVESGSQQVTATINDDDAQPSVSISIDYVTQFISDVLPGFASSSPTEFVQVGNFLYFRAQGSGIGRELWKTDGTSAGTVLVKDIAPGTAHSEPEAFTNVNGVLYFKANNGTNGNELWKSDGTCAGTVLVRDINPGAASSVYDYSVTNINGVLYFAATNGTSGYELWKTDGTCAGTVMIRDIGLGNNSAKPRDLTEVNGVVYFSMDDAVSGRELWKTDGTCAGTQLVSDINPGSPQSVPNWFVNFNGTLIFAAISSGIDTELWKSDGTSAGTVLVKDINPGAGYSAPNRLFVANDVLYFRANDGTHGSELWKSDGTCAGTLLVKDIQPGNSSGLPLDMSFAVFDDMVYFRADDGSQGAELWKTDGTCAGTTLVKDINPGAGSSLPTNHTNLGGVLYFTANDGVNGFELWKTDGTSAGTVLANDIRPGSMSANLVQFTIFNGQLIFSANDGTSGGELWGVVPTASTNVAENGGSKVVTAMLSNPSTQDVTINLSFTGSAVSGVDYSASAASIVIPAGQIYGSITLTITNDTTFEGSEAIVVDVTGVTNGTENGSQQVTATINDDDSAPSVTLSLAGSPLAENGGVATVTATLSNPSTQDVTVNLGFTGTATNVSDYSRSGTSITITAGNTSGSITLTGINDVTFEGSETVIVDVTGVTNGTENGTQQLTATITDDDSAPTVNLTFTGINLQEPAASVFVRATLSNPSSQPVTIDLGFSGTATFGVDYTGPTQIVIPAGSLSSFITLSTIDDAIDEPDETILVDILNVTGGTENGSQQISIPMLDSDLPPTVTLSVADSPLAENGGVATVTATLSSPSGQDVTINLGFTGTATNISDYSRSGTQIVITAGNTSGSITITGVDDVLTEGAESVIVDITGVTNGTESGSQQVTATINDDENAPSVTLSLAGSPLAENGGVATVTATLSNPSAQDVTVNLSFNGTTNGSDYNISSTSIVITAGNTSGSMTITAVNDLTDEPNETVIVDISTVTNGTENGVQQVVATINDDDPAPSVTLQVSPATLSENGGVSIVRATLSNPSADDVTISLGFTGTATNLSDYSRSATQIVILAGNTSGSITLTGVNDTTFEGSETVTVDVTGVTNGTENGSQQVTATINDDDSAPSVTLSLAGSPLAENGGVATVTATLSNPSTQNVTIDLGFTGTASSSDYSLSGTSIIITAGNTSGSITLTGVNDAQTEGNETVIVDVTSVTNGTESGSQQVTATIADDDGVPSVTLSLAGSPLAENGGVATVTATLSNPSTQNVTIDLDFTGTATNASDYSRSGTQIVITAGNTSGSITLTGVNDITFEGSETLVVDITGVTNGVESGTQQVTATINDDDAAPSVALSLAGSPLAENGGVATVTATLSNPSTQDVTVNLAFTGTATNVSDYSRSGTSITITAGNTSGSMTITGVNDITDEANETVIVDISGVTNGAESGSQQVTATINDDDNPPTVTLSLAGSPFAENGGVATVTATLSNPSSQDVTVDLGFTGSATNLSDYSRSGTSIVITAGNTSGSITLTGIDDVTDEANETVIVDITSVNNGVESGTQQVTATINDDDSPPSVTLSLAGSPLAENGGVATVTATLSNPSSQDVTVDLAFSGTASSSDYSLSSTSIVITAGNTSGSITITGVDDLTDEPSESVVVDIVNVSGGTENGMQQVTATINDDDETIPTVTLAFIGSPVTEGGSLTLQALLSNTSSQQVTVNLGFSGTATFATDYTAGAQIVIPAGSISGALNVNTVNDTTDEPDETIVVDVTSVANGTEVGTQQATATITDNDPAPSVTLSLAGSPLAESGGVATISASLSNPSSQTVTINLSFTGSATLNTDYSASGASIVITAGNTSGSITLTSAGDTISEINESIAVDVASVTGGTENGSQQVTATIAEDDRYITSGPQLTIAGSPGIDEVVFRIDTGTLTTVYGGETRHNPGITTIVLTGFTGDDIVKIVSQPGVVENATLSGNQLTFSGGGFLVTAQGAGSYYVYGQAEDTMTMIDTAGDDSLYALPAYAVLQPSSGVGFIDQAIGFGTVIAKAINGGTDSALFYDAAGNDTYISSPTQAALTGLGYSNTAEGFEKNYAFAIAGGNDTATLNDSAAADVFSALSAYAIMDGGGEFSQAIGFDTVIAIAGGGNDTANFYDSVGDDNYVSSPTQTTFNSAGVVLTSQGFESNYAFSSSGGNDTATLNGSSGDDILYAQASYSALVTGGVINQPIGFKQVTAIAGGGNDLAYFYDSVGNDNLAASGNQAQLTWDNGRTAAAQAFDTVFALSSNGGTDDETHALSLDFVLQLYGPWA